MTEEDLSHRARALREAFDAAFARPPPSVDPGLEDFLIVAAGADRYVLRLSEVASVHVDRKVTPVLSPMPELLGLADFHGRLTPIYAAGALLGCAGAQEPRFLVVARHAQPVGFAFTALQRHLRVAASELMLDDLTHDPFTQGAVRIDGSALRILELTALVDHLAQRMGSLARKDGAR